MTRVHVDIRMRRTFTVPEGESTEALARETVDKIVSQPIEAIAAILDGVYKGNPDTTMSVSYSSEE